MNNVILADVPVNKLMCDIHSAAVRLSLQELESRIQNFRVNMQHKHIKWRIIRVYVQYAGQEECNIEHYDNFINVYVYIQTVYISAYT